MSQRDSEATAKPALTRDQFWNLYLQEHRQLANCWLHVLGTVSSWIVAVVAVVWQLWWLLIFVPLVGYGPAWLGHLFVEGNRPLSIRYPFRSLMADYRLTWQMLTGGRRGVVLKDSCPSGSSELPSEQTSHGTNH